MFIGNSLHNQDHPLRKKTDDMGFLYTDSELNKEHSEIEMVSWESSSIPSIFDGEEKYVNIPQKNNQWKRLSLRWKNPTDFN